MSKRERTSVEQGTRRAARPPRALFTFKEIPLFLLSFFLLLSSLAFAADSPSVEPVKAALKAEKWDAAVEAGEKLVKEAPENGSAHWRLGRVLERGGKKDEARASYKEALRLDPTLEGAKKDLERLGG